MYQIFHHDERREKDIEEKRWDGTETAPYAGVGFQNAVNLEEDVSDDLALIPTTL